MRKEDLLDIVDEIAEAETFLEEIYGNTKSEPALQQLAP